MGRHLQGSLWGRKLGAGLLLSRLQPSPPTPEELRVASARRWVEEWDSSLVLNKKELELGVIQRYSWPKKPETHATLRENYPSSGIPCSPEQQAWADEVAWNLVRLRAFQRGEEKLVSASSGPSSAAETTVVPHTPAPTHPLRIPLETFGSYQDWVDHLAAHPGLPLALVVATSLLLLEQTRAQELPPPAKALLVGERGRSRYRAAFSHHCLHRSVLVETVVEGVLEQAALRKMMAEIRATLPPDSPTLDDCASHPSLRALWALTLAQERGLRELVVRLTSWGAATDGTRTWAQFIHQRWLGESNPTLDPESPLFQPPPEASTWGVAALLEDRGAELAQDED